VSVEAIDSSSPPLPGIGEPGCRVSHRNVNGFQWKRSDLNSRIQPESVERRVEEI